MRYVWWGVTLALIIAALGVATAQPTPDPGTGSNDPGSGSGSGEPTLEPERIATPKPPAQKRDDAITVDQLVVSSTNRIDLNFFGDVSFIKLKGADPDFAVGPLAFQVTARLTDGLTGKTKF